MEFNSMRHRRVNAGKPTCTAGHLTRKLHFALLSTHPCVRFGWKRGRLGRSPSGRSGAANASWKRGGRFWKGAWKVLLPTRTVEHQSFPGLVERNPKLPNCNHPLVCCNFGARWGLRWTFAGRMFFWKFFERFGPESAPKTTIEFGGIRWNSVQFGGNRVGHVLLIFGWFCAEFGPKWIRWNSVEFGGIRWSSVEFGGIRWNSVEFGGIRWNSVEFGGNSVGHFLLVFAQFWAGFGPNTDKWTESRRNTCVRAAQAYALWRALHSNAVAHFGLVRFTLKNCTLQFRLELQL